MTEGAGGESVECWIYRGSRHDEMYLYVAEPELASVPEELLKSLGRTELVMTLTLSPRRALARCDVAEVMRNLRERGYHLQMPPEIKPLLRQGD